MKKHYILLSFIVFFLFTHKVNADILINEIQISPIEERFIELYNTDSYSISLTGYYLQRKTDTGTSFGSLVSKTYFDGTEIKGNSYLVIAKASNSYSDIILDNFTLTDSNTLQLKNPSGEIVDIVEFGIIPESKSYQKLNNNWIISNPTPGKENEETNNDADTNESNNDEDNSTPSSDTVINKSKSSHNNEPKIVVTKANIVTETTAFVGLSHPITSVISNNRGITSNIGKFVWSFGDGEGRVDNELKKFDHIYEYKGEYVLTLSYYKKGKEEVEAKDKVTIKVIDPGIYINSVGSATNSYIELINKSTKEMDISGFIISGMSKNFIIPYGTIILPNKTVKISSKKSGFSFYNLSKIIIKNKNGEVISTYPNKNYSSSNNGYTTGTNKNNFNNKEDEENDILDLNDNLEASAGKSKLNLSINYYILVFIFIIGVGVVSVFLLRKNIKNNPDNELENQITSDNIKILE